MTARWIVFDYGEVISQRTRALPSLAATIGAPADDFEQAYWHERRRYDRGCGDQTYWTAVGSHLGVPVDEAMTAKLVDMDVRGWLDTVDETVKLITDLRASGRQLALLSNAPSSFGRAAEVQTWAREFEHLLFSGDLLVAKPDAEIWRRLLSRIDAPPAACLFFDDRQENIDSARDAGLAAELWQGPAHAREVLGRHALLT